MEGGEGGRSEQEMQKKKKIKLPPRYTSKGTPFYHFVAENRRSKVFLHLIQCLFEVSTYKVALLLHRIGITWPVTLGEGSGWRAKLTIGIRNFN